MQIKRCRPNQLLCAIDVTAFASVMLVLLWLFMFRGVDEHPGHRWTAVDMPKAVHAISMRGADREDAMVVAITRNGKIFFRSEQIIPDQLPAKIREAVSQGAERKVYTSSDARAKYSWVVEVVDNVQSAGIEKIGFLVEQRRTAAPNPQ